MPIKRESLKMSEEEVFSDAVTNNAAGIVAEPMPASNQDGLSLPGHVADAVCVRRGTVNES